MRSRRGKPFAASIPRRSRSWEQDSPDYRSTPTVRQTNSTPRSLNTGGEDRLKLRILFFTRDHAHFDLAKAAFFQKFMQPHLAETEPAVGIKFARFFEAMTQQVEHDYPAVPF